MNGDLVGHSEVSWLVDPRGRPTVMADSDHCFCTSSFRTFPSVPTFQNKTNIKRKHCSLLTRLWVWPSGSLMTHLTCIFPLSQMHLKQVSIGHWMKVTRNASTSEAIHSDWNPKIPTTPCRRFWMLGAKCKRTVIDSPVSSRTIRWSLHYARPYVH